jgi:hypothetical protein
METKELTIRAEGVNQHIRLTQRRKRERSVKKRNATLDMAFNSVYERVIRKGQIEVLALSKGESNPQERRIRGTFSSLYEGCYEEGYDYELQEIILNEGKTRIEITKRIDYLGQVEFSGIIKTRNHWYEKWKSRQLKNLCVDEN